MFSWYQLILVVLDKGPLNGLLLLYITIATQKPSSRSSSPMITTDRHPDTDAERQRQ